MGGLGNIIFNLTFLSMIFQCLRRACLYILPRKITVILGVEDQRYCCGLVVIFVCLFVCFLHSR